MGISSRMVILLIAAFVVERPFPAIAQDSVPPRRSAQMDSSYAAVYVSGHADDWILFSGDNASDDADTGKKLIIIYASAGEGTPAKPEPWAAREEGAKAATELIVHSDTGEASPSWSCAMNTVNAHPLWRCAYRGSISYFLRLSNGFGFNDLKLGNATVTVDNQTVYTSWADFRDTLEAIIVTETAGLAEANVTVHAHDFYLAYNAGDHPDHRASGEALEEASRNHGWEKVWYRGYRNVEDAPNLTPRQYMTKAGLFLAYDRGVRLTSEGSRTESGFDPYVTYCESFPAPALYSEFLRRTIVTRTEGIRNLPRSRHMRP